MSFVVDTDICIAYLQGNHRVYGRFMQHTGGLYVSAATYAEIHTWVPC